MLPPRDDVFPPRDRLSPRVLDGPVGRVVRHARRSYRRSVCSLLLAVGVLVAIGPMPARAGSPATPDAPLPDLCTVAPLAFDDLNAIIERGAATPAAGPTPAQAGRDGVVPAGTGVPADVENEIADVVREYVACQNAGELLRAYALYTDDYLARLFIRQGVWGRAAYDALATPMPDDDREPTAILGVRGVRLLPDGRVGATVTITYASIPMPKTFFFTFVRDGAGWAIDDILGEISFSVP